MFGYKYLLFKQVSNLVSHPNGRTYTESDNKVLKRIFGPTIQEITGKGDVCPHV
jgi:hypothetical protein